MININQIYRAALLDKADELGHALADRNKDREKQVKLLEELNMVRSALVELGVKNESKI